MAKRRRILMKQCGYPNVERGNGEKWTITVVDFQKNLEVVLTFDGINVLTWFIRELWVKVGRPHIESLKRKASLVREAFCRNEERD